MSYCGISDGLTALSMWHTTLTTLMPSVVLINPIRPSPEHCLPFAINDYILWQPQFEKTNTPIDCTYADHLTCSPLPECLQTISRVCQGSHPLYISKHGSRFAIFMHKVVFNLPIEFCLFKISRYIPVPSMPVDEKFSLGWYIIWV